MGDEDYTQAQMVIGLTILVLVSGGAIATVVMWISLLLS